MVKKDKLKISWDTKLIFELMKVAGICEYTLKDNIQMICVIVASNHQGKSKIHNTIKRRKTKHGQK